MDQEKQKPTIDAIARQLGVSKTTVSRALSGKGRISRETRERVAACALAAGYEAAGNAVPLVRKQTHNLALVIPSHFVQLDLPFLRKCMGSVCGMAAQREYDVLVCFANERDTRQLRRQLAARKVDGVILTRTLTVDPCLDLVREYGIPYVAIGRLADASALQVDNDQVGAARELTTLLLQKGIQRIAYLGNRTEYTVNEDRLSGFRQAMEDFGMALEEDMIFSGVDTEDGRLDALEAALERKPECLLCGDDSLAFNLLTDLRQRGLHVPRDIRIASLYDSELLRYSMPAVTAVQFDAAALGAAACRLLLDAMAGREVTTRQVQGYQVVLRESTK